MSDQRAGGAWSLSLAPGEEQGWGLSWLWVHGGETGAGFPCATSPLRETDTAQRTQAPVDQAAGKGRGQPGAQGGMIRERARRLQKASTLSPTPQLPCPTSPGPAQQVVFPAGQKKDGCSGEVGGELEAFIRP